jgi:hypothetical protein
MRLILLTLIAVFTFSLNSYAQMSMPDITKLIHHDNGDIYASDYLIVVMYDEFNNAASAKVVANYLNSEVIGGLKHKNWWQISVRADSLEKLKQIKDLTLEHEYVQDVIIDNINKY